MSADHLAQQYLADCPKAVQDYVVKLVAGEREACAVQLDRAAVTARAAQVQATTNCDAPRMLHAGTIHQALTDAAALLRGGA